MAGVPNKPKTPLRSVRIPDELWERAQQVASKRGETVSDEIRAGLQRYTRWSTTNTRVRDAAIDDVIVALWTHLPENDAQEVAAIAFDTIAPLVVAELERDRVRDQIRTGGEAHE